jgi:uncharacterized protein
VIYLDSSAVVKLVRNEAGTAQLVTWLRRRRTNPLVSSALVEVEVPRALRRYAPSALVDVPAVLARLYRVEIDATIRATAAAYQDDSLRSLDAIHLATAQLLMSESSEKLDAFVAYDRRLLSAAAAMRMPIVSPGLR